MKIYISFFFAAAAIVINHAASILKAENCIELMNGNHVPLTLSYFVSSFDVFQEMWNVFN